MEVRERERIRKEYGRLCQIEKKEREAEVEKREAREAELMEQARQSLAEWQNRLRRLGVEHLLRISLGSRFEYIDGIAHPKLSVDLGVHYLSGRTPEVVLGELLDRIEGKKP